VCDSLAICNMKYTYARVSDTNARLGRKCMLVQRDSFERQLGPTDTIMRRLSNSTDSSVAAASSSVGCKKVPLQRVRESQLNRARFLRGLASSRASCAAPRRHSAQCRIGLQRAVARELTKGMDKHCCFGLRQIGILCQRSEHCFALVLDALSSTPTNGVKKHEQENAHRQPGQSGQGSARSHKARGATLQLKSRPSR